MDKGGGGGALIVCHLFLLSHLNLYLQTLADFLDKVANLLSTAVVGGTPRLNSSLHSSKMSSETKTLSLMLNKPIKEINH